MRPADWDRAEELFHRLVALAPGARAGALAEVSSEDPWLGSEVESLLEAHDTADGPLDVLRRRFTPAALEVGERPPDPIIGTKLGHYEVIEIAGRGGMGDVYRALDTRLNREVALKFLPRWLGRDPSARDRFLVEARVVSSIDHPNVCTLLEMGETDDGRIFLIMPFYRGETLKSRLRVGPLPWTEAVEIALQAARGLAAAHERGIVHRDVKPDNLFLTDAGGLKILDFGVAKLADVSLTRPGVHPGTASYMAPEQAAGQEVDHRADLWSLGLVLEEMLTGSRPRVEAGVEPGTGGASAAELPAESQSEGLASVLNRLRAIAPTDRYPDARTLIDDLEALTRGEDVARGHPMPFAIRWLGWRRRRAIVAACLVGILLAAGGWIALDRLSVGSSPGAGAADGADTAPVTVAVVAASAAGDGDLGEGLAGLVARGLDDVPGLRSAPENLVLRGWRARDVTTADSAAALRVARSVDAAAAIVLSASSVGTPLRVQARVYPVDAHTVQSGSVPVQGSPDELIELVDELSARLVTMLLPNETSRPTSIAAISTRSLPAMRAFLLGERALRRNEYREAVPHFARAVAEDTTFALAWHRLTTTYGWTGQLDSSMVAGEHAGRHADQLPRKERLIVLASAALPGIDGALLREVEDAVRVNPDDWQLLEVLSEMYLHGGWRAGISPRRADSVRALAAALVPGNPELVRHGIDLALGFHHDSSLADRRIAEWEDRTGHRGGLLRFQRALAFDELTPDERDYWLGRVADDQLTGFPYPLAHPLSMPARVAVNEAIAERDGLWSRLEPEFFTHVTRGRLAEAVQAAASPDTSGLRQLGSPACHVYMLAAAGIELDGTNARRWLSESSLQEHSSAEAMLCLGGRAVDEGRRDDAERWIERMRTEAHAMADTVEARRVLAAASALFTYARWRSGESDALIDRSVRLELDRGTSWPIRWWAGSMLAEAGRTEEAIEVFESFWFPAWVPAFLERADLLRAAGREAEARELYEVVLNVWADADPAFAPLTDRARAGLAEIPASSS